MPVYKKVNKKFFKNWTRDMAYVLGFFAADGYITVNKRGGQFWCIQITDKKLLDSMKKVIDSDHKISTRNRKKSSENTQFRLQIGSIEMCNDLRNLGFSERKTKSMVIPNIPQKFFADFVRGYFEGDGNVWVGKLAGKKKNSILTVFTSGSLEFLKSLKLRLFEANITKGGSLFSPKKDCYRLQFSITDSLNLYDFMYNSLIRGNSLFLQRKKSVFEKFLRMRL